MLISKETLIKTARQEGYRREKLEIMISKGLATSRLKDFWDVYSLLSNSKLEIREIIIVDAIKATFGNRNTFIESSLPAVFTEDYYNDQDKTRAWKSFLKKSKITERKCNSRKSCSIYRKKMAQLL